jgi:hypothetical protein
MPLHSALEAAVRYVSTAVSVCASERLPQRSVVRTCHESILPGPGLPVTNSVSFVGVRGTKRADRLIIYVFIS